MASRKKPCPRGCGNVCDAGSPRCHACRWSDHRRAGGRTVVCPACGGPKHRDSAQCWDCKTGAQRAEREDRRRCPRCGGVRTRPQGKTGLCRPCLLAERGVRYVCPGCGKRKPNARARLCRPCHYAEREQAAVWQGVDRLFDPEAFRAVCDRWGWSLRALADASRIPYDTLYRWVSGVQKPRIWERDRVVKALALEPCPHCLGKLGGYVDPGLPAELAMVDRLTRDAWRTRAWRTKRRNRLLLAAGARGADGEASA